MRKKIDFTCDECGVTKEVDYYSWKEKRLITVMVATQKKLKQE